MRTAAVIAGLCALLAGCVYPAPPASCSPAACAPRAPGAEVSAFFDAGSSRLYRSYPGRIHVQQVVPEP